MFSSEIAAVTMHFIVALRSNEITLNLLLLHIVQNDFIILRGVPANILHGR